MHLLRRGSRFARVLVASLAGTLAHAQAGAGGTVGASTPPTFASVATATMQQDYSIVAQRRFLDDQGKVVSVREKLDVDANGTSSPDYTVTFLGVCGEPGKSPSSVRWQQTYQRYGRLFVEHGSFHVRSLGKIQQNYSLHHCGTVVRAGRLAFREVVFPMSLDKSTWLIDFDAVTHVPLYQVEFDSQFRLLAEVEAETFTQGLTVSGVAPMTAGTSFMATPQSVTHANFAAARAFLGDPAGVIDPGVNLTTGYELDRVITRDDPLNGQQKIVVTYTDGVDQFMLVQTPGSGDVFAGLIGDGKAGPIGNSIGRYRDPALTVLVFWDDDVLFHVAGRGGMQTLDDVAEHVYRQALSSH